MNCWYACRDNGLWKCWLMSSCWRKLNSEIWLFVANEWGSGYVICSDCRDQLSVQNRVVSPLPALHVANCLNLGKSLRIDLHQNEPTCLSPGRESSLSLPLFHNNKKTNWAMVGGGKRQPLAMANGRRQTIEGNARWSPMSMVMDRQNQVVNSGKEWSTIFEKGWEAHICSAHIWRAIGWDGNP